MPATSEAIDVVILTVLPQEYKAVCDQFEQLHPLPGMSGAPNIYAWKTGTVSCSSLGGAYTVSIGMMGRAGTPQSALATVEAIQRWKPRYIFFVGIAGGLSKLDKGDVVISDVIHGFEYGKIEAVFLPRDDWTYRTDLGLLNGANDYALSPDWQSRVRIQPPSAYSPKIVAGEVASGDKVIDDPTNAFFEAILKRWPKVVAVEMEGAGVGAAIEQAQALGHAPGFMMIRGISDVPRPPQTGETRGTTERDNWKPYASATAAAFTVGLIAHGLPELPHVGTTDIKPITAYAPISSVDQSMPEATINHQPVIELFTELMRPNSESRALRLLGDAKLGKTHFIKTIFPGIARQQYHSRCAIVDLRSSSLGPVDLLHDMCAQLGGKTAFPMFHIAYDKWLNRPRPTASELQTLLSQFQMRPDQEASEIARLTHDLLTEFVTDLAYLRDAPIVLFFDAVDLASPNTRLWLMDTLLARVLPLSHLRAVIGGRSMPEVSVSYAIMCYSYELQPVMEEEAYILYCQEIGIDLLEQSIRDRVRFCEHKPGMFVDSLGRKSLRSRVGHA